MVSGRYNDEGYGEEYKRRVTEMLREASVQMGEELQVNEVYETFMEIVIKTAAEKGSIK